MAISARLLDQIKSELQALDRQWPDSGKCYHLETDPPHVLFNLNCPEELENRVRQILSKYTTHEGHPQ